ncbi:MAG: hypothetical protein GEU94_02210 [Micromonosporaceae bacterium]|nr:hypothetical protein [Micromonosporaceae bacterium]
MPQPTDPPSADYARGQIDAYRVVLVELDELTGKLRQEIAALQLPTRKPSPRPDQEGGQS